MTLPATSEWETQHGRFSKAPLDDGYPHTTLTLARAYRADTILAPVSQGALERAGHPDRGDRLRDLAPGAHALTEPLADPDVSKTATKLRKNFDTFTVISREFIRLLKSTWCLRAMALALLAAMTTPVHADTEKPVPPQAERAREIRLTGNIVTLPIVMVREFPFIEGSVAGVRGKFMLDTGIEQALTVNDHRVPISGGRTIGKGFFESGQTFSVRLVPELGDIRIGDLSYPRATDVTVQDARMLEGITPDFIGWLGYQAFTDHALKLDYRDLRATFYGRGPAAYLKGERVVAELPFKTRKLPNHPVMTGRIGAMPIITTWDTGQHGTLHTTESGKMQLLKEGRLTPSRTKPDTFDLHGLQLNGHPMPVVPGIDVETEPSPAAKPVGIVEPNELTIGYGLLHQFKTVWDYQRQRIYLLVR